MLIGILYVKSHFHYYSLYKGVLYIKNSKEESFLKPFKEYMDFSYSAFHIFVRKGPSGGGSVCKQALGISC